MNVGVTLILYGILKTDGGRIYRQGCHDVFANFGYEVPKPALLLDVQVVEAGHVATGSNQHVSRCQGLSRRDRDPILAGEPDVVPRNRAEEAASHLSMLLALRR